MTHLGHRLEPFLPALLAITTRLLAEGTAHLPPVAPASTMANAAAAVAPAASIIVLGVGGGGEDRSRELRISSLKLLAQVREGGRGRGSR